MRTLKNTKKFNEEESEDEEGLAYAGPMTTQTIGLVGEVSETTSRNLLSSLLTMQEHKDDIEPEDRKFDFYISTHGGSASDMFAIYDIMRDVRKDFDIATVGIGKVMSAGVLLLAAGTKGIRRIGRNCRVMIHSVVGMNAGPMHNLENEMKEARWVQDRYFKALIKESNGKLSKEIVKSLLDKKIDIYLSAEEAVKYGIADIIF